MRHDVCITSFSSDVIIHPSRGCGVSMLIGLTMRSVFSPVTATGNDALRPFFFFAAGAVMQRHKARAANNIFLNIIFIYIVVKVVKEVIANKLARS